MRVLRSRCLVPFHYLPTPPSCVVGTYTVPFIWLKICQGSGTSRRSGHDAGERLLGTDRSSRPGLLQSAASDAKGVRRERGSGSW